MSQSPESSPRFAVGATNEPALAVWLRRAESLVVAFGIAAFVTRRSVVSPATGRVFDVGTVAVACLALLTVSLLVRYVVSRTRRSFLRAHASHLAISTIWLIGLAAAAFGMMPDVTAGKSLLPGSLAIRWSEAVLCVRAFAEVILLTRRAAAGGTNPSVIVVATFVLLIATGSVLLMLPASRGPGAPADEPLADRARIAVFTSTSASCVTGLVVVPTGGERAYWSRFGQTVILILIQTGGLGIMTMGAFFAVISGRHMPIREHVTIRDMLETERLGDVRKLVLSIAAFTALAELVGAVALSGLWPDLPPGERAFHCAFHAVSGFCNAGFALMENNLVGYSTRWEVVVVIPSLIIVGGLGFGVLRNLATSAIARLREWRAVRRPVWRRAGANNAAGSSRVTLTSRLVVLATAALLVGGAVTYFLLEFRGADGNDPLGKKVCDAWFQSVTFRTAGFYTVDHERLQPATKLFGILLMFVGASPGSTGGGIKTTCFALSVLGVASILRGRTRVEFAGRTIPDVLVHRALTIILLGMVTVATATMLIVLIERNEARFLDQLYEATAAFGTAGVSANLTPILSPASHYVLIATMFLGRVGPLTLLVAVAGRMHDERYEFPAERVTLG